MTTELIQLTNDAKSEGSVTFDGDAKADRAEQSLGDGSTLGGGRLGFTGNCAFLSFLLPNLIDFFSPTESF
jgi:hypothetical protein